MRVAAAARATRLGVVSVLGAGEAERLRRDGCTAVQCWPCTHTWRTPLAVLLSVGLLIVHACISTCVSAEGVPPLVCPDTRAIGNSRHRTCDVGLSAGNALVTCIAACPTVCVRIKTRSRAVALANSRLVAGASFHTKRCARRRTQEARQYTPVRFGRNGCADAVCHSA